MKATPQVDQEFVNISSITPFSHPYSISPHSTSFSCKCTHILEFPNPKNPHNTLKTKTQKKFFPPCTLNSCFPDCRCTFIPCSCDCLETCESKPPLSDNSSCGPTLSLRERGLRSSQKARRDTPASQGEHSPKTMWVLLPSNQGVCYV